MNKGDTYNFFTYNTIIVVISVINCCYYEHETIILISSPYFSEIGK